MLKQLVAGTVLAVIIAIAGPAMAGPLEKRLASSFDAEAGSLLVYPVDCGPDEIHEDCDVLSLSCGTSEVYGFGAGVERLGDDALGRWLLLNGATLTLTNGSSTLEMVADSMMRDGYDGSWDSRFYPASKPDQWLKTVDKRTDIVAHTIRGEWVFPRAQESDLETLEAFLHLCVERQ